MKCLIFFFLCQQFGTFLVTANPRPPTMLNKPLVNNSREILLYAKMAEIRNFMNQAEKPCNDFYQFSCGNWARINPASLTVKTGLFQELSKSYDRRIGQLLMTPKLSNESVMDRKVKYFFDSCMDLEKVRHNYREYLLSIMEEFGGMPALKGDKWRIEDFDWLQIVADILRKYGKQIIIGVNIAADINNSEVNKLYIGELEGLVTSQAEEYYSSLKLSYQREMQVVLGMSSRVAYETAEDVVNFLKSLARGISDPLKGIPFRDTVKKQSLEDMTNSYQPMLNFTRFISTWLGYNYYTLVYENNESYQQNLQTLIEKTPLSVIANYIMWELIQGFRLEAAQTEEKQKPKCVEATKRYFLKYLDRKMYMHLLDINEHVTDDVLQLWGELKQTFMDMILSNTSSWLTTEMQVKALGKISSMTMEVNAYETEDIENEYENVVIRADNFFENILNIMKQRGEDFRHKLVVPPKMDRPASLSFSPAYSAEFNTILIPVACLQPHFLWDPIYPAALKYATMGYMLSHEMAHGFDNNMREYDAEGNLTNWWDESSTKEFLKRKECFSQQYSEYKYAGQKLPRSNAQDENIADNVGIQIAFNAYQNWQSLQNNVTMQQENSFNLLKLKPNQLFFVGVAQVWCADVNIKVRQTITKIDVHMPEEVRVTGMISNVDKFAEEFQCQPGDRMDPQQKCVIF